MSKTDNKVVKNDVVENDAVANMVTFTINDKEHKAAPGSMLIEVTDAADIHIPRFCYHKKLTVAANCRMCLVEVEKAPKPLPACATPVMEGMTVCPWLFSSIMSIYQSFQYRFEQRHKNIYILTLH